MSNQTGIIANDELLEFFGKCREGKARDKFRIVKVIIVNEQLALDEAKETKGSWKEDWDGYVLRTIDDNEPCYLLYRFVVSNNNPVLVNINGSRWKTEKAYNLSAIYY
jgi:twinfilin-like protein